MNDAWSDKLFSSYWMNLLANRGNYSGASVATGPYILCDRCLLPQWLFSPEQTTERHGQKGEVAIQ